MSAGPYQTLLVEHKERVCVVTLNRPRRKNAFNREMYLVGGLCDAGERFAGSPFFVGL
jgi:hypothetical protein